MDEKIKTWTLSFPAKENPNNYGEGIVPLPSRVAVWRQSEASIDIQKVLGHEAFLSERSLNQPKATRVCTRSIN